MNIVSSLYCVQSFVNQFSCPVKVTASPICGMLCVALTVVLNFCVLLVLSSGS